MMYTLLKSDAIKYRNTHLYADIASEVPDPKPDWWAAKPIHDAFPVLTFTYRADMALPDNVKNGTIFDLYSSRLIALIQAAGVRFETFPALIVDKKTKQVLSDTYQIFHLLERHPGLDRKKTLVNRPVMSQQRMAAPLPLFRDQEYQYHVLIHRDLRATFAAHQITGCRFEPVLDFDDVVNPPNW